MLVSTALTWRIVSSFSYVFVSVSHFLTLDSTLFKSVNQMRPNCEIFKHMNVHIQNMVQITFRMLVKINLQVSCLIFLPLMSPCLKAIACSPKHLYILIYLKFYSSWKWYQNLQYFFGIAWTRICWLKIASLLVLNVMLFSIYISYPQDFKTLPSARKKNEVLAHK